MLIFGVMMVRNEGDILSANILHHFAQGIDRFLIVDNGSTDNTAAILEELSADGRVRWTRDTGPYRQSIITTELAREAFRRGADWVIPIDADEFWVSQSGNLRSILEGSSAGALGAQVINFVQRRDQDVSSIDALLTMTRRVPQPIGTAGDAIHLVSSNQIAFVEMRYPLKWITRASSGLEIGKGNHTVSHIDGPAQETDSIVCLHAPLRAPSSLRARMMDHGRHAEELQLEDDHSWHVRRWKRLGEAAVAPEWMANSYLEDSLHVYGEEHELSVDLRLRDVVAPWVNHPLLGTCSRLGQTVYAPPLVLQPSVADHRNAYDESFFATHDQGSMISAQRILPLLFDLTGTPLRVIDFGCGTGTWLHVCRELGSHEFLGIDGEHVDETLLRIPSDQFRAMDLNRPIVLDEKFDLAISLEVAEHLEEKSADTFMDSLVNSAPMILFSAAIPHQGGTGHLNEQFPSYWAKKFSDRGFHAVDCLRSIIWADGDVEWWYRQNSILYVAGVPDTLPPSLSISRDLDIVHPALWSERWLEHDATIRQWESHAAQADRELFRKQAFIEQLVASQESSDSHPEPVADAKSERSEDEQVKQRAESDLHREIQVLESEVNAYRQSKLVRLVRVYWSLRQRVNRSN